jgi:hypothetical protein
VNSRALLVSAFVFAACPPPSQQEDAGNPPVDSGVVDSGTPDAGEVDAGFDFGIEADAGRNWSTENAESTDALCSNTLDDDTSGYPDCDDFWCSETPTVWVCDSLENTDAKCSDNVDNSEHPTGATYSDGLVDCADPDCGKNERVTVCPALKWELRADCANGIDDDGDTLVDCADPDCLHAGQPCALGNVKRVLFDDSHRERAGSADWTIDISGRHPFPSAPVNETDWSGQISSFGKALFDTGHFSVESLPPYSRFTFDAGTQQDLSNYSVVVIAEPSAPFSEDESHALVNFVLAGGGLLMVADHFDSDRDGNGWDSVTVFNDMFTKTSTPFGFTVTSVSFAQSGVIDNLNGQFTESIVDAGSPVTAGITRIGMHKGGLFTVNASPAVVLVNAVPLGTTGYENGSPYVVASTPGLGRVVAVGDSAIINDGTDSHGRSTPSFNSWGAASEQNGKLFVNAVEWLAQ